MYKPYILPIGTYNGYSEDDSKSYDVEYHRIQSYLFLCDGKDTLGDFKIDGHLKEGTVDKVVFIKNYGSHQINYMEKYLPLTYASAKVLVWEDWAQENLDNWIRYLKSYQKYMAHHLLKLMLLNIQKYAIKDMMHQTS